MKESNRTPNQFAPPTKAEQIESAHRRGPSDSFDLNQLAQHCDGLARSGEMHYGYLRAEQLRLLAKQIEQYDTDIAYAQREVELRDEQIAQLQRTVADLAQQVEDATTQKEQVVFQFVFDADATPDSLGVELFHELALLLDSVNEG